MSTHRLLKLGNERMLRHCCGRCLQPAGTWCTTASGRRSVLLHSARFYAAQAAGDLPLTDADVRAAL